MQKNLQLQRGTALKAIGSRSDGCLDPSFHPPLGLLSSSHAPGPYLLGLPNSNFEDGLAGWNPASGGTGTVAIDSSASITGANSVLLTVPNNGDTANMTSGFFPCGEGIPSNILVRTMLKSGNPTLYVQVVFFDGSKSYHGNQVLTGYTTSNGMSSSGFVELGYSFTPPAGTRYAYAVVQASATSTSNTGAAWVNEVRVQRAIGATDTATGLTMTTPAALGMTTQGKDFAPVNMSMLGESIQGGTTIFGVGVQHIEHSYTGGKGARCTLYVNTTLAGPSNPGSDNQNYVAGYFRATAFSGDQGTASSPKGAIFGSNPVVALNGSATNFLDVCGEEIDCGMYAGTSAQYRTGLTVTSYGTAKANVDAAIKIGTLTNADTGYDYGLIFFSVGQNATPATRTLITGITDSPTALTAQAGIDFSAYTFSGIAGGYAHRWTNTSGVLTDGSLSSPKATIPQLVSAVSTVSAAAPQTVMIAANNATDRKAWLQTIDTSGNFFINTVNDAQNTAFTAMSFSRGTGNSCTRINVGTSLVPGSDAVYSLGGPSNRFAAVYAANGLIQTSDENEKEQIADLPEALLDAIGDLAIKQFRFKDAVARKGAKARTHIGVLAQDVERVCKAHGVDGDAYGFFCRDPLFEDAEEDEEVDAPVMRDEDYEVEETTVVDGAAHRSTVTRTRSVPVLDRYPVIDAATGEPVMTQGWPETPKIVSVEVPMWDVFNGATGETSRVTADDCPPGGKPALADDGRHMTHMVKRQAKDADGNLAVNPAIAPQPVYHDVPRVERKTVKRTVTRPKLDDKGEPVYLHGVRYDQIAMAMVAALRRKAA